MKIKIIYCEIWNYLPQAASLAEDLKNNFNNIQIELLSGNKGDFIVFLDDIKIYSRKELIGCSEKRLPNSNEIIQAILRK